MKAKINLEGFSGLEINLEPGLPPGYGYYQYKEDIESENFGKGKLRGCAYPHVDPSTGTSTDGGCPAVMVLSQDYDTKFDKQWQFYLYAINQGMTLAAIIAKLGDENALANKTGFREDDPKDNYLTGNVGYNKNPWLDKLRTFSRNIHLCLDVGNDLLKVVTLNGNYPPLLKGGERYPAQLTEVNVNKYYYTPQSHPEMFLVMSNVKAAPGGSKVFPFAHGVTRPWRQALGDNNIYTYFPLVSIKDDIIVPKSKWNKISDNKILWPSYYRM